MRRCGKFAKRPCCRPIRGGIEPLHSCPARRRRVSSSERQQSTHHFMEELMRNRWVAPLGTFAIAVLAGSLLEIRALAQADDCKNRGQLDTLYCDDNKDLVADPPKDPKKHRDPSTLVFAYTPVEDPAVYEPDLQAVHRLSGAMHRQARGLLPGQLELCRDRGDALGPAAFRRLLNRTDRLRGQPRRRGAVRRQGHRERPARLSPDRRS